jgi:beta-N-acetylhexosaminidase
MIRMSGVVPDPDLVARIHDGQVGGVILFGENAQSATEVASLVSQLQAAARSGGNPPLLISTDQEGRTEKRLPCALPDVSPPAMSTQGVQVSETQGRQTGTALRSHGINVDLAPVVDGAHSDSAFIWHQQRSFGMDATIVTDNTSAFANGMESAGVAPTAKHFPGVGGALTNTDYGLQRITLQTSDLQPYHQLIAEQVPLIMVSTAIYENLDPSAPAALSPTVISGLLRQDLHYHGVVMTDDLERPTGHSTADAVVHAAQARADIVLVSTTETAGAVAYRALLSAAQTGQISPSAVSDAYQHIMALKKNYAKA